MQITRLPNGVRVLSERLPDLASVTVGIWVENGSRYEREDQAGISHFLEHLFFKGTARRTAAQIAEEIDAVGGVLNAFTGKEYTCYYAKVLSEHLPLALDLLADIFTQSKFAQDEIDRERTVIIQGSRRSRTPRTSTFTTCSTSPSGRGTRCRGRSRAPPRPSDGSAATTSSASSTCVTGRTACSSPARATCTIRIWWKSRPGTSGRSAAPRRCLTAARPSRA